MIAIVLAAGQSKRMHGPQPKVLLPLLNRPLVSYVLDAIRPVITEKIIVVVGAAAAAVKRAVAAPDIEFVLQPKPKGTAQAVMMCADHLPRPEAPVMVLCGDVPLVTTRTVRRLVAAYEQNHALVALVTARLEHPEGYGRIVRNGTGDVAAIVEERDAAPPIRAIHEINAGIYVFQTGAVRQALAELSPSPVTHEYYLTDTIKSIAGRGRAIGIMTDTPEEILGVNTPDELARIEAILRQRVGGADRSRAGS